jgi:hypothetical protein
VTELTNPNTEKSPQWHDALQGSKGLNILRFNTTSRHVTEIDIKETEWEDNALFIWLRTGFSGRIL